MAMAPVSAAEYPWSFCRNVGYKSCVPCENELKPDISKIRKRKVSAYCRIPPAIDMAGFADLLFPARHTGDSSTFRPIYNTSNAGVAPTTNSPRQPTTWPIQVIFVNGL